MVEKSSALSNKVLILFFSTGVSLKMWDKVGNLSREIEIYNRLADYFKNIYFITYGKREEECQYKRLLKNNIEILPKKILFLPNNIYIFLIPFLYRKFLKNADLLKTNQMQGSIAAVITKLLYKNKLVVRCGYEWLRNEQKRNRPKWKLRIVYLLEKYAYQCANKIIITSLDNKRFIQDNFKVSPYKIEIIPNYINTRNFKPFENVQKKENKICYVGRLIKDKNLFNLIEAISGMPIRLVAFGSGPLKKKLEVLAGELKANVEFRGNVPNKDLPTELNKSEVFILPSYFEGNPKALLEAMSCGLPCIGTNVEGIKEIIRHKENGYLCETNAESIKKALLEVLGDKRLQEKIGHNARETILENFSLNTILEKELKIYESL